jgi:hypothetical protein
MPPLSHRGETPGLVGLGEQMVDTERKGAGYVDGRQIEMVGQAREGPRGHA